MHGIIPIEPDNKNYSASVGICLLNAKAEVFVLRPRNYSGCLAMPQGNVKPGDKDSEAAVYRRLASQIGVASSFPIAVLTREQAYLFDQYQRESRGRYEYYQGKRQTWFYLYYCGDPEKICLSPKAEEEFSGWTWIKPSRVAKYAPEHRIKIYARVSEGGKVIARGMEYLRDYYEGRDDAPLVTNGWRLANELQSTVPVVEAMQNWLLTPVRPSPSASWTLHTKGNIPHLSIL